MLSMIIRGLHLVPLLVGKLALNDLRRPALFM